MRGHKSISGHFSFVLLGVVAVAVTVIGVPARASAESIDWVLMKKAEGIVLAVSSEPVAPAFNGDASRTGYDIFVVRTSAESASWSEPVAVTTSGASEGVKNTAPSIRNGPGLWLVVWMAQQPGRETCDILSATADGDGDVWSYPTVIAEDVQATVAETRAFALHYLARYDLWLLLWQSLGESGTDITFATATAHAADWTTPRALVESSPIVTANGALPAISAPPGGPVEARWYRVAPDGVGTTWYCSRSGRSGEGLHWSDPAEVDLRTHIAMADGLDGLRKQLREMDGPTAKAPAVGQSRRGKSHPLEIERRYVYAGSAAIVFYAFAAAWFFIKWARTRSTAGMAIEHQTSA